MGLLGYTCHWQQSIPSINICLSAFQLSLRCEEMTEVKTIVLHGRPW